MLSLKKIKNDSIKIENKIKNLIILSQVSETFIILSLFQN